MGAREFGREVLQAFIDPYGEQRQVQEMKAALREIRDLSADWPIGDIQTIHRRAVAALDEES